MALGYKTGGRKKGSVNKTSAEVREYCARILARIKIEKLVRDLYIDEKGRHKPLTDVSARVLERIMQYGWGMPKQDVEITVNLRDAVQAARQRVIDAQVVETPLLEAGSGTTAQPDSELDAESLPEGNK